MGGGTVKKVVFSEFLEVEVGTSAKEWVGSSRGVKSVSGSSESIGEIAR